MCNRKHHIQFDEAWLDENTYADLLENSDEDDTDFDDGDASSASDSDSECPATTNWAIKAGGFYDNLSKMDNPAEDTDVTIKVKDEDSAAEQDAESVMEESEMDSESVNEGGDDMGDEDFEATVPTWGPDVLSAGYDGDVEMTVED